MATRTLTFVTSNPHKVAVARQHLAPFDIAVDAVPLELDEIQAVTVREVALHKARQAFAAVGRPLIVEDTGLYIDELGMPGPFIKPLLAMMGAARLAALADQTRDRRCHFESVLVYLDGVGEPLILDDLGSTGTVARQVATGAGPESWSGVWDFYIPDGYDRPAAALTPAQNEHRLAQWSSRSVFRQLGEALTAPTP